MEMFHGSIFFTSYFWLCYDIHMYDLDHFSLKMGLYVIYQEHVLQEKLSPSMIVAGSWSQGIEYIRMFFTMRRIGVYLPTNCGCEIAQKISLRMTPVEQDVVRHVEGIVKKLSEPGSIQPIGHLRQLSEIICDHFRVFENIYELIKFLFLNF
jgi:hypothetical protein